MSKDNFLEELERELEGLFEDEEDSEENYVILSDEQIINL